MAESVSQVVEKTTVFHLTSFLPVNYFGNLNHSKNADESIFILAR
jgi:hypothetical protein